MIGRTLDRYRIDEKLGEGGMGVVYKAVDTHLNRTVALKVLPPDKVADAERRQRFVHEARAASALNHPGIVTVHDIGAEAGIDFIVMEYVPGQTLDRIIPSKGMDLTRALRLGAQIADALARAHQAGIVHRDLKPANVIVTDDDRIKVLDFGLAKLVERVTASDEAPTRTAPLTGAGIVVGTTAYMSPEQAEGKNVDARSDIFSFGAVLYEALTGRRPFAAESNLSLMAKIVHDDPPAPTAVNPSIPTDVERAVLRCLRKDPARRYQTMADLKVALDDLATDSTASQPAFAPVVRRVQSWRWASLALIPVVLAGGYFALTSLRPPPEPSQPLQAVPLTSLPGVEDSPSFSPDGNQVAFAWNGSAQDNQDVYVQQIGAGVPLRLTTDPADDFNPQWSPDGRAIAFMRPHVEPGRFELRLVPPLGGPERKITDVKPRGFLRRVTLAWCPDARCIVLTDSGGDGQPDALFTVWVDTGEKRQLTTPPPNMIADTDPAISPNGHWLVFRRDTAPFSGRLMLVPIDSDLKATGDPRSVTSTLITAYAPRWISNSDIIFGAKGALWRTTTSEGAVPARVPFVGQDAVRPVVSRSQPGQPARLAYVRSYADSNIWRLDLESAGAAAKTLPTVAIASTQMDFAPQLSPDGRRVTFDSTRSGENEIWVADLSGANAVQVTSLGANPGYPSWSPDGSSIVFQTNSEDVANGNVFVVSSDGGRVRNLTVGGPATSAIAKFSSDGRWVYYQRSGEGLSEIWKVPATGGEPVRVTGSPASRPIESRDGAFLYYVESIRMDVAGSLWRQPVNGGDRVKILDRVLASNYDVVDLGVYYIERADGEVRLRFFSFATGRSTSVAERLGNVGIGLSATRDGRTIVFQRTDSSVDDLMLVENFR